MGVNYYGRDLQDFPRLFKKKKKKEEKHLTKAHHQESCMLEEKENMFYITGVLITGFSPEKPEIRHEKCRLLSPRFLSLDSILFSFSPGNVFPGAFFSLSAVIAYRVPVWQSFDLIFLRHFFF